MKMIQTIKENIQKHKLAAGFATGLSMAVANPSVAHADESDPVVHGAIELMEGQESGTLDVKVLVLDGDVSLLSRNRVTVPNEDGSVSSYSVNRAAYGIGEGVSIFGEVDAASGAGLTPRAGMQHFCAGNGYTLLTLLSIPIDGSDLDILHIGKVTYLIPVTYDLNLATALETLTSVNGQGLSFAVQRFRVGAGSGNYQIGAAADLKETVDDTTANVGIYTLVSF